MNTIDQFEVFVDFIANIDKQKAAIEQLKAATKQYQDALSALSNGQSVKALEKQVQAKADKIVADQVASQKVLDVRSASLDQREKDLNDKEVQLGKLTQEQVALTKAANDFMAMVTAKQVDVDKKMNDVNAQIDANNKVAADLAAKQAALAKVFK